MIVKIKSLDIENKSQFINITEFLITGQLFSSEIEIIRQIIRQNIEEDVHFIEQHMTKGTEVWFEFIGNSKIDGFPMFKLDKVALVREIKLNEILNS